MNRLTVGELTLGVAEAAVADRRAAPPLHGLQVFVVPEVTLLHRRREVFHHRVELTQHVAQILLVHQLGCRRERSHFKSSEGINTDTNLLQRT